MSGPAWSNQVQNKVLVAGVGGGVFVYDPTVANGNLIASITDATTGPTGETTQQGITSYQKGTAGFTRLINHAVSFNDGSGTTWLIVSFLPGPRLAFEAPNGILFLDANGMLHASDPSNVNNNAPWVRPTPAGLWANITGAELEYMLMPDDTVSVHGQLTIPTGVTGPSNTIATVGAPYVPSRNEPVYLVENLAASPFTGTIHHGLVRASTGNLDIFGAATAGNTLNIQVRYPLTS